jgi:hypothetical protein
VKRRKGFIGTKELADAKRDKLPLHNVAIVKELKVVGFKVVPSVPTPEQVAKINRFTRKEFKAEELYVGQLRLSNNGIDRDNERFSEEVLQRFTATSIRRTMLLDHDRSVESAIGKFFDVELEKMPLQQAIAEIGEELVLPDGITEVLFHSPWFYIPREGIDPQDLVKIDAGIYDFASIGFRAESLVPVMDKEGDIRFWEYRGSGRNTEMTEGSLVYLGAQYGMAVKSAEGKTPEAGESGKDDIDDENEGGKIMKALFKLLGKLFPGKSFTEEGIVDEVKEAFEEMKQKAAEALSQVKEALKTKITELEAAQVKVKELTPLAEDGKAYRDDLLSLYVANKAKLGEVGETPEAQEAVKKVAAGYPVDFLKSEVAHLQTRVEEKFPDGHKLKGDERRDKSTDGKGKKAGLISEDWEDNK